MTVEQVVNQLSHLQGEIYIYGAGRHGKMWAAFLEKNKIDIVGFVDKNTSMQGKLLEGKKVYSLDEIDLDNNTRLLIGVSHYTYKLEIDTIQRDLKALGGDTTNLLYFGCDSELLMEVMDVVYSQNPDLKKNELFKNKYKGKRCFVIGNGPSLKADDLQMLQGELSFACNGIIHYYDKTNWRPTFFFCGDILFSKDYMATEEQVRSIANNSEYVFTSLLSDLYYKYNKTIDNMYYLLACSTTDNIRMSEDICKVICAGATTLYKMIEVAIYMGIEEIYLIGADFSFKNELHKDGSMKINENVKDHSEFVVQSKEGIYDVDIIYSAFMCAKEYAESHNIKIYNATRGGKLEVFNRVNLDNVINNRE